MATAQTVRVPAPELFNPQSGRLDAARIAHELNVPVTTIAVAIGRKAPGVRKHPDSSSLQSELRRSSSVREVQTRVSASARV